jgi:hypothetical protein
MRIGEDRGAFLGRLVEADIAGAARQAGEVFHSLDHPADDRDIAIKLARGLSDDGVELRARAGVGRIVAAHADGGVAVERPHFFSICANGPALPEQRRVGIGVLHVDGRVRMRRSERFMRDGICDQRTDLRA